MRLKSIVWCCYESVLKSATIRQSSAGHTSNEKLKQRAKYGAQQPSQNAGKHHLSRRIYGQRRAIFSDSLMALWSALPCTRKRRSTQWLAMR